MRERLVAALREWRGRSPQAPTGDPAEAANQAVDLFRSYGRTGNLDVLNAAIELFRDALSTAPPDYPHRPACAHNLGTALTTRFERTGQQPDLDEAITAGRDAVTATPPDHPDHPTYLSSLGAALAIRSGRTGQQIDLDHAISAFRETIATTPLDHSDRPMRMSNLGTALRQRFERTGQRADLDDAVAVGREAVATTPPDHPERSMYLSSLSGSLCRLFESTGELADLDDAVAAGRDAVVAAPPDHPNRCAYLSNLGAALHTRFERTGELVDLDEAVAVEREAVAGTAPDHPDRPMYLSNLGNPLRVRFERTGQQTDLDHAISAFRDAIAATPPDHPDRPARLSQLGGALRIRFESTGQRVDLDDAIAAGRGAVVATPADHSDRPARLSNFGVALRVRFESTDQLADLDEAITAGRLAVIGAPPGHPTRPMYLSNLGLALRIRFERTGDQTDLDEAITAGRDAVAATPPDHTNRPMYLSNLVATLRVRFERTGEQTDLDEAITAGHGAVATTPHDHFNRPMYLYILGLALRTRFERTDQQADLDDALAAFANAVRVESGPPAVRLLAGLAWGSAAIDVGRVDSAAEGFAAAVGLLPLLVWHGLPRATREQHLTKWSGLAAHAAACAIRAGRPERAVELLEAGRSVLWAQILNLRTDLADLADREPDLATRLDQIRTLLDTPLPVTTADAISAGAGDQVEPRHTAQNRAVEDRMRLAREFDELLTQVRGLDGFEHFLAATPFTQLRAAATGGPVVIVNTSPYGCHALLLTTTGVQVVELPDLTDDQAIGQANALLGVLDRVAQPDRPFRGREKDRHTIFDILGWLWDTVADPILTSLGHTSPPAPDTTWPRIWWCPTGPLTVLPLHAAGHHHRHQRPDNPASTDTVPDRVISSYTPTLTALLRARAAAAPTGSPRLLAVGMPTTPGAGDLPAVPAELDRIHARYPIATRLLSPTSDQHHSSSPDPATQPTTTRVIAELPHHPWVHLSCHGSQHVTDPTESAFWLSDGPLRITDLIEQGDPGLRELAFLSACQTATGDLRALDEAIHLAAAMQLLGYRHVIATLWSIYDSPAPDIADTVYAALTATGTPDANHAAHALHHAVTALRAKYPTEPLAWAPYLHTGP